MKHALSFLLSAAMLLTAAPVSVCASVTAHAEDTAVSAVWDGSSDTSWYEEGAAAFTLTTAEQLSGLADLVGDGHTMQGVTITLGADLRLNDTADFENWTETPPAQMWWYIGESDRKFEGTFDGAGHTITGMYTPCGLFQFLGETGEIRNLRMSKCQSKYTLLCARVYGHVADCDISGVIYDSGHNEHNHGGICSSNEKGLIERCTTSGNFTSYGELGGICGLNYGTIRQCTNEAALHVMSFTDKQDRSKASILGDCGGIVAYYADGVIEDCKNTGAITGSGIYNLYVGGIAGSCDRIGGGEMMLRRVHNSGSVTTECVLDNSDIGGIIGCCAIPAIRLEEVSNSGDITAFSGAACYVGGIFGHCNNTALLEHVWNTGAIEGSTDGNPCAGGISGFIGNEDSVLRNVYNTGSVTALSTETRETSDGEYHTTAGGLAAAINKAITVQNVYNTGTITASWSAGALFGRATETPNASNCYYLSTSAEKAVGRGEMAAEALDRKTMLSEKFANQLGSAFAYLKDSYPVLTAIPEPGDLDGDKAVSVKDVVALQKYILLVSAPLSDVQYAAADMNADGEVDVFDLALLKRFLLQM